MSGGGTETPLYRTTTFLRHQAAGPESGTHRRKGPRDPRDDLPGDQYGRRRRAGTGWQSPPVYLQPRCRHKGMMYTVIALYGPAASIPFQRYCTSIEAVSTKEAGRLVLEEADDELIVAGVLEGEHDMVDEDPTLNPEDAEVASV